MVEETIFQHWIVTQFILPFLLIWTIVFAILEKTNLLGEDKKQLDAIVAFVIGLIFVGAIFPKMVVGNLILFLTVAIVVVFVALLLWGFVSGGELKADFLKSKELKWVIGIAVVVAVAIAVLWASGIENSFFDLLFRQSWSSTLWTNIAFIAVVAIALALVLKSK
jgi:hypothetical protein